jgi:hypothetical protein
MRVLLVLLVTMVVMAIAVPAQTPRPKEQALTRPENWGLTFGLEGLSATYDPPGALQYEYKTRGNGLNLNVGMVWIRHILFGGEIGAMFFGGDEKLTANGVTYRSETTNSTVSSIYAGIITSPMGRSPKMGRKWWAGVLAGQSKWSGERRMDGCLGCATDRLHMVAGPFLEPFFMFGGGDKDGGGGFRLGYRRYVSGSRTLQSAVRFGVFFDFIKL